MTKTTRLKDIELKERTLLITVIKIRRAK